MIFTFTFSLHLIIDYLQLHIIMELLINLIIFKIIIIIMFVLANIIYIVKD